MKDIRRALSIFLGLIAISVVMGCAISSTKIGHSESDPTKTHAGSTWPQVDLILKKRLWRLASAGGPTLEIYDYRVKRPAHPVAGAGVGQHEIKADEDNAQFGNQDPDTY